MMRNISLSLTRLLVLNKTSRTYHVTAKGDFSNWKAAFKDELAAKVPVDRGDACIYRVPVNMRDVQPSAYAPSIISIGPYHHGQERLQEMEELKWKLFRRLFCPQWPDAVELDPVMKAMKDLEQDARRCYWDKAEQHSEPEELVRMMLLDGVFIVELLRELKLNNFQYAPSVNRWMLPTLRRDLIMLENQLPLFVLQKLFELTRRSDESTTCLEELALRFFNPLLQSQSSDVRGVSTAHGTQETLHFLDLFRLSLLPRNLSPDSEHRTGNAAAAAKGIEMMRSTTELMEAGVVFERAVDCPPLDVRSEERWLKIPPLYLDDHKGTLFRNMVAYEQCHTKCRPYVTSYLFLFDGLINSADDVQLLHHKGVLHHSLGSNKEVARLVNGLCKEVTRDGWEPYLHKVVSDVNTYCNSRYAQIRARLVHHYFSSWVVGISTFGAIIVLYLTLIQTGYGFVGDPKKLDRPFHHDLMHCLILPIIHPFSFKKDRKPVSRVEDDYGIRHWKPWMFSI